MFQSSPLRCAPYTKIAVLGAAKLPLRIEIRRGSGPSGPPRGRLALNVVFLFGMWYGSESPWGFQSLAGCA